MHVSKLKPPVRTQRLQPLRASTHYAISRAFEEAIFRYADVLSEGLVHVASQENQGSPVGPSYTGSTMLSVALSAMGKQERAEFVSVDRALLASALDGSMRVRLRAMRLAMAEASRRCTAGGLGTARIETRIRLEGEFLHIDVDVEAPVQQIAGRRSKG